MEMLGVSINVCRSVIVFFFNDTATTEIYTLSLHDALPICPFSLCIPYASIEPVLERLSRAKDDQARALARRQAAELTQQRDRKSTRLNSSHANISYAVFCLKKKKKHTSLHFYLLILTLIYS